MELLCNVDFPLPDHPIKKQIISMPLSVHCLTLSDSPIFEDNYMGELESIVLRQKAYMVGFRMQTSEEYAGQYIMLGLFFA